MKIIIDRLLWPVYLMFTGLVILIMGMVLQDVLLKTFAELRYERHWFPVAYIAWVLITGIGVMGQGAWRLVANARGWRPSASTTTTVAEVDSR